MSFFLNLISKTKKSKILSKDKDDSYSNFSNRLIITDLDKFFSEIYEYYYMGGYGNIFTQTILDNITNAFTIHFLLFNVFFIEWKRLIDECQASKCEIELTNYISNRLFKKYIYSAIYIYVLLMIYFILFSYSSIRNLISMKKMHSIYRHKLHLKTKDLENLSFDAIMNLIIDLQQKENFCRVKETVTKYDIIARISRKDNFLNAVISNSIIDLSFSIPLIGRRISLLTNYIYTSMTVSIMNSAFKSGKVDIDHSFYSVPMFQMKMMWDLLFQLFALPCEVIFRVVFWLFKNADYFRGNKSIASKTWGYEEMIKYKNYNELKHHFESRLNEACTHTDSFLKCFKQKLFSLIGKAMILIGGSILFIVFLISLINIKLTYMTIYGNSYFWALCVIGFIVGWFNNEESNSANAKEKIYSQIENYPIKKRFFKKMINCLINIPKEWSKVNISRNFRQISLGYYLNVVAMIQELASICFFPLIWMKILLQARELLKFIKLSAIKVDGIGTVCSLSVLSTSSYLSIKEKDLIGIDKQFNDAKFINSMLYYEKHFLSGNTSIENNDDDLENSISNTIESVDITNNGTMPLLPNINNIETPMNTTSNIQPLTEIIYALVKSSLDNSITFDSLKKEIFFYSSISNHSLLLIEMSKAKLNYTA